MKEKYICLSKKDKKDLRDWNKKAKTKSNKPKSKRNNRFEDKILNKQLEKVASKYSSRLENNKTESELIFEEILIHYGILFRSQYSVVVNSKLYILDYLIEKPDGTFVNVEIDGAFHLRAKQKKKDRERTLNLKRFRKIETIRFLNSEIDNSIELVVFRLLTLEPKEIKQ